MKLWIMQIQQLHLLVVLEKVVQTLLNFMINKLNSGNYFTVMGLPTKRNRSLSASVERRIIGGRSGYRARFSRSKRPQNVRQSKFDIENRGYGKAKICMILRRDFGVDISESSTGRIMKKLRFPRSRSALRRKKNGYLTSTL
ncbi:MAG: hypothetical protein II670_01160 [Alphaproteobacteria bacterium]|nr:hypothetical protein [Alphaproteobacteria bacterium]